MDGEKIQYLNGVLVIRRGDRYFALTDSGDLFGQNWLETEITAEMIPRLAVSDSEAADVLWDARQKNEPRRIDKPKWD